MEENTSRVYVGPSAAALTDPLIATPAAGSGTSLFIINLCASIAPIQAAGKALPGLESYKLYQVARNEDGRTRHRLRLGFFTSEADAEQVLATVRDNYPTAFVTCLSDDDRRYARGFVPDPTPAKRPVAIVQKPAPVSAPAPVAAKPAAPKTVASPAAVAKPAPETKAHAAAKPAPIEVARQPEAQVHTQTRANAKAEAPKPTPVVDEIELSWDPPALKAEPTPSAPSDTATSIKTVAPVFKTDTVIKARPAESAKPKAHAPPAKQPTASAPIELTLTLDDAPVVKPAPEAHSKADGQPFHVGKGIEIPASALTLEPAAPQSAPAHSAAPAAASAAKQSAPAAKAAAAKPAAKTIAPKAAPPVSAKTATPPPAPVVPPAAKMSAAAPSHSAHRVPELDSTQTIRALTTAELDGEEKWYSIQLVVSEQPVNLDAMPHLDIFEAYRVYSIANAGSGKIVYSLRLGFFREEVSAQAVGGYLKTFFPSPSVIRISTAEQLRFKDAPAPKATAIAAAKSEAKVIELNQARDRKPATIPTVTMEVDTSATGSFKPGATGSFNPGATGSFKPSATGSFKVNASGTHKALKPAAKTAPPATKRSAPLSKASSTGKHKAMQTKKSLQEQLLEEAREVQLSESAIRKLPKNDSLLSRLVGKLTK